MIHIADQLNGDLKANDRIENNKNSIFAISTDKESVAHDQTHKYFCVENVLNYA